jgi:hypothetical protein
VPLVVIESLEYVMREHSAPHHACVADGVTLVFAFWVPSWYAEQLDLM